MCKGLCKVPRLLLRLHFSVCVCVHARGQIPHTLNYARCIFTVEPISSSIDSCSGAILFCSCWYFNYRGNLSKSRRLLASTLMRHLSRNQYCSSQPGLELLIGVAKAEQAAAGRGERRARPRRCAKELSHQCEATAGGGQRPNALEWKLHA